MYSTQSQHNHNTIMGMEGIMNKQQFNKLYSTVYDAYDQAALKDEYVRSTLGDVLDHLILLEKQNLIELT